MLLNRILLGMSKQECKSGHLNMETQESLDGMVQEALSLIIM